ncbi:RnfABCDGE type electron transport complex subunit D [uncultured Flavonifractor sp.]|uniref:RnfABCDGE type electron transport complex subunit D n=1 Tax=uncultured Flavonifractor sp. TaxID=1193534 RepID=UPI0026700351|nr:RnfABCDGE type electron transport complex subunit D [uncultured Flavonifractor sp.]
MKLLVTSSPHIHSGSRTSRLMGAVLIALIPALVAGVWFFGIRALVLTAVTVLACLLSEWLYRMVTRQSNTLPDLSAAVTGVLLAMTLPASAPYWLAAVGGVFAIVVVKGLIGGLGQNIFNPALAARAFLVLFWPSWMVRYAAPGTSLDPLSVSVDIVSSATPLHHMQMPALPTESLLDVFLGNMGGCIGEVSALALLLGGGYLLLRKVISWRIPVAYLGSVALLTLIFSKGQDPVLWMLYSLMGGGVLLGAFFMATDYATSPVTPMGQLIYGVGCGVLTVCFRYYGLFPEGVTYAILLMNACAWSLDRLTPPKRFGTVKGGGVQ